METSFVLKGNSNSFVTNPARIFLQAGQDQGGGASFGIIDFGCAGDKIGANIIGRAHQDFSSTKHSTNLEFHTCNTNTNSTTKKLEIKADGDIDIVDGNLKLASGHGIDFSATSDSVRSGTATASSVLNDYEEGTWTPTGNGYTMSNTSGNCYYTKIGNVVHVIFRATWPSLTSTTFAEISNLPYRVKNTTVSVAGGAFSETNDNNDLSMIGVSNSYSMYILKCDSSGVVTQNINAVSTKDFRGTFTYLTDDN